MPASMDKNGEDSNTRTRARGTRSRSSMTALTRMPVQELSSHRHDWSAARPGPDGDRKEVPQRPVAAAHLAAVKLDRAEVCAVPVRDHGGKDHDGTGR